MYCTSVFPYTTLGTILLTCYDQDFPAVGPTIVASIVANIIFVDAPVGTGSPTGFSYSKGVSGSSIGDIQSCQQTYRFLRNWLIDHPEFLSNPIYIGGDSYTGITGPLVVKYISDGYLLGNALTKPGVEGNAAIPLAHGLGLLSEELYKCTSGINAAHVLEPKCILVSPRPNEIVEYRRSLAEKDGKLHLPLHSPPAVPEFKCRVSLFLISVFYHLCIEGIESSQDIPDVANLQSYGYMLSYYWANDNSVREALHIKKGTVPEWQRCSYGLPYINQIGSSFQYHVILSKKGYRSLIYSGDHDMMVPHLSTQDWIRDLNYSIVDDWRPWAVEGQVGGYTRKYANNMTFATVKGGGHIAPEYQPEACYAMFKRYLPGFQGPLPFELETGYVGVDEVEDVQLFYYFVKSYNNPKEDPVLLWLTGGPACSGFSGFVYEIGPVHFVVAEYDGSLPKLMLNPYSWTNVANIIFVDAPVGTGFSYSKTAEGYKTGDIQSCQQAYQFLRNWLIDHPEFMSNPIYIGGDSYTGITAPLVVKDIFDGNEEGNEPFINLKGYLLGNAMTKPGIESNAAIPLAHGLGLLSEELYESMKRSCRGQYTHVNPSNAKCLEDVQAYHKCTSGINFAHILEPKCILVSPRPNEILEYRTFLAEKDGKLHLPLHSPPAVPELKCRSYGYMLSYYWANNKRVREALHIKEGTVPEWQRCSYEIPYNYQIGSSFQYHVILSERGYRSLIYNGDHDMIVPHLATQEWIRDLNYSIVDDWRPWAVEGQVGGYTRKYANNMTFATIKGGGHTAPEYQPEACYAMFKRWISEEPL
ncbi:hypothetical protein GIB67_029993 [Kingdonia uniflora]|uniref:Serine carboxypeptidase-like 7 n=1 Tax=Kingdonia uniflora TaxID=39325 RepID=A0A7J7MXU6_9MAGN|nr:hypothetical protein GIB67_029993 [Kingdonia uniflora]